MVEGPGSPGGPGGLGGPGGPDGRGVGLQDHRGSRSWPTGSQGVKGQAYRVPGGQGVDLQGPRGSRGHLWDPFVPSDWFDETSDDP